MAEPRENTTHRRAMRAGTIALALLLAGIVFSQIAAPIRSQDVRPLKAQLGCRTIARAIEAYRDSPSNPNHDFPRTLGDLVQPPFGGPSFLKYGEQDLLDPWGNPYRMHHGVRTDGTDLVLISTTSPDGTQISQYGVGEDKLPKP